MFIIFLKHIKNWLQAQSKILLRYFLEQAFEGETLINSIYKDYLAYDSRKEKGQCMQNDFPIMYCIGSLLQE